MARKTQNRTLEETYLDKHRKCGIKVGDKVRVMRKCKSCQDRWDTAWIKEMDASVGMIGIVIRDEEDGGFALKFEDMPELSGYYFPYFVLQKVENEKERAIARVCKIKAEAQALANFLWNEKQRHLNDIRIIDEDLGTLAKKWGVRPTEVKAFVKP